MVSEYLIIKILCMPACRTIERDMRVLVTGARPPTVLQPACPLTLVVIVVATGATRGIGRAIVTAIAARGKEHVIYLGCRDPRIGAALAASLGSGSRIVPLELDVMDGASIANAAATVTADLASSGEWLDALVNNAGVLLEREGSDLASIVEPTLRVNVDGVVAVTDKFILLLCEGGRIINVSSGAGTRATALLSEASRAELDCADTQTLRATFARLAHAAAAMPHPPGETPIYGLSKAALNYYTRLVARETAHLRVNACSPGFCRTEIAGQNISYTRQPKDASLGADVVAKLLFGDLGTDTGSFYKECSKPGTPLDKAHSAVEPWVA